MIQDIKIPFITDYSYGADAWDGIDLVDSKTTNNHRTYRWTKNSKNLLLQYKNERNGGVDVSKFLYTDIKSDIKAIVILGKTIFCKILSGRGEKKIENKKFKIPF